MRDRRPDSDDLFLVTVVAEEAEAVETMARRIWQVCYADLLSMEQVDYMLAWMYAPERIRKDMGSDAIEYRWLRLGDETVGFAAFGPGEDSGEIHLHKLYVLVEKQGKGIGSAALKAIEASARAAGARRISLHVNRGNHGAIRAYETNGFERAAEVCSDIGGGFVMDDYVMVKRLD